jgi:methyl-accepting chemotaxis protein
MKSSSCRCFPPFTPTSNGRTNCLTSRKKFQANNQHYEFARAVLLAATAIALVIGVVLSILIARGFSVPLGKAVAALELMADGGLTTSVEVDKQDEVGRMAVALNMAVWSAAQAAATTRPIQGLRLIVLRRQPIGIEREHSSKLSR